MCLQEDIDAITLLVDRPVPTARQLVSALALMGSLEVDHGEDALQLCRAMVECILRDKLTELVACCANIHQLFPNVIEGLLVADELIGEGSGSEEGEVES